MNKIALKIVLYIYKMFPLWMSISALISKFLTLTDNWQIYIVLGFFVLCLQNNKE